MTDSINTMFVFPFADLDLQKLVGLAMEEKEREILAVNKRQLNAGFDAKGDSLGRYKNFKYKGRYQPVDLYKTGDFWNKFTLTAGKKGAEVFSQDAKAPYLEKKYGKEIMGIASDNKEKVASLIDAPLGQLIKKTLFK